MHTYTHDRAYTEHTRDTASCIVQLADSLSQLSGLTNHAAVPSKAGSQQQRGKQHPLHAGHATIHICTATAAHTISRSVSRSFRTANEIRPGLPAFILTGAQLAASRWETGYATSSTFRKIVMVISSFEHTAL